MPLISLENAILDWNKSHGPEQQIVPGSTQVDCLGKTILVHYSKEYGYRLEDSNRGLLSFVTTLHDWFGDYSELNESQKLKLAEIKKVYQLAGESQVGKSNEEILKIQTARVRVSFGKECAQVFASVMSDKIYEDNLLKLEDIIKDINKKQNITAKLPEIDVFLKKADELINHHKNLHQSNTEEVGSILGKECSEAYSILLDPLKNEDQKQELLLKGSENDHEKLLKKLILVIDTINKKIIDDKLSKKLMIKSFKYNTLAAAGTCISKMSWAKVSDFLKNPSSLIELLSFDQKSLDGYSITPPLLKLALLSQALFGDLTYRSHFGKLLDTSSTSNPYITRFQGFGRMSASGILKDLIAFEKEDISLTDNDKKQLSFIISQLKLGEELAFSAPQVYAEKVHRKLRRIIRKKIPPPNNAVVFQFGTATHAVLGKITVDKLGGLELSVINTGEGASIIKKETTKGQIVKSRDTIYSNLSIDLLSLDFLFEMFSQSETATHTDQLMNFLDSALLSTEVGGTKKFGPERTMQKRGTCASRCWLAWMREAFNNDLLFEKFKISMAEHGIRSLEEQAKAITPAAAAIIMPAPKDQDQLAFYHTQIGEMHDESRKVLARRQHRYKALSLRQPETTAEEAA